MGTQVLSTLMVRIQDLNNIFDHYGEGAQTIKLLEELNECATAVTKDLGKYLKEYRSIENDDCITFSDAALSEMADALIMLIQIATIHDQQVSDIINFKIDRTLKAMKD